MLHAKADYSLLSISVVFWAFGGNYTPKYPPRKVTRGISIRLTRDNSFLGVLACWDLLFSPV